jgi:hypothetical protein
MRLQFLIVHPLLGLLFSSFPTEYPNPKAPPNSEVSYSPSIPAFTHKILRVALKFFRSHNIIMNIFKLIVNVGVQFSDLFVGIFYLIIHMFSSALF